MAKFPNDLPPMAEGLIVGIPRIPIKYLISHANHPVRTPDPKDILEAIARIIARPPFVGEAGSKE